MQDDKPGSMTHSRDDFLKEAHVHELLGAAVRGHPNVCGAVRCWVCPQSDQYFIEYPYIQGDIIMVLHARSMLGYYHAVHCTEQALH